MSRLLLRSSELWYLAWKFIEHRARMPSVIYTLSFSFQELSRHSHTFLQWLIAEITLRVHYLLEFWCSRFWLSNRKRWPALTDERQNSQKCCRVCSLRNDRTDLSCDTREYAEHVNAISRVQFAPRSFDINKERARGTGSYARSSTLKCAELRTGHGRLRPVLRWLNLREIVHRVWSQSGVDGERKSWTTFISSARLFRRRTCCRAFQTVRESVSSRLLKPRFWLVEAPDESRN
jgi:hypothetical protein